MTMSRRWRRRSRLALAGLAVLACSGGIAVGQGQVSADAIWEVIAAPPDGLVARTVVTAPATILRLNRAALDAAIQNAPPDRELPSSDRILTLPLPGGSFGRFRVAASPVLAPEIAAVFPEVRTLTAQGLDDPTATARIGWTAAGFHAIILSAAGTTYVDPYAAGNVDVYLAVSKATVQRVGAPFICQLPGADA